MNGGSALGLEAQSVLLSSRQFRLPINSQSHGGVLSAAQQRLLQRHAASTSAMSFSSPCRGLSSVEQVSGGDCCRLQPEAPGWEKNQNNGKLEDSVSEARDGHCSEDKKNRV